MYEFLISLMHATCIIHLILLYLVTLMLYSNEYWYLFLNLLSMWFSELPEYVIFWTSWVCDFLIPLLSLLSYDWNFSDHFILKHIKKKKRYSNSFCHQVLKQQWEAIICNIQDFKIFQHKYILLQEYSYHHSYYHVQFPFYNKPFIRKQVFNHQI